MGSYNVLLIIGNGFDLDLGLKTGYGDFLKSRFFTENCEYQNVCNANLLNPKFRVNIFDYLNKQQNIKGWIDLETELANLASRRVRFGSDMRLAYAFEKEKSSFQKLRGSLAEYLKTISYNDLNVNSYALSILNLLNDIGDSEILTFNYTDINQLAPYIGKRSIDIPISYLHGNLEIENGETSIILGFQDDIEIDDSYCFMIKSHSPYYRSYNIKSKLNHADEVIFFGHSLGSTDYPYFADFFTKQCQPKNDEEKITVRIFTKDESSRQDILIQLRNMNQKHTQMLYEYCDFAIYRTDNMMDDDKIQAYLSELRSRMQTNMPYFIR